MLFNKPSARRYLSAIAIAGSLITGLPTLTTAQGLPGFTLFGGGNPESQLNYRLDYGNAGTWDRYRLRIPSKKVQTAIAQFAIDYPEHYEGKFDKEEIEVLVEGKSVPLQEVIWDQDNRIIEIYPQDPIPAANDIEIVFSNVLNPTRRGMFQFNCRTISPGDVPLLRYLGTWLLTIG